MELRIVAHLSGDEAMSAVFLAGGDIHTKTATGLFGVGEENVTKEMRRHAKTVNFGILYGLSAFGLSSRIAEIESTDAKSYIEKYFATYPGVWEYLESVKLEVREKAEVRNQLGRLRKFPEIKSSQFFIRQAAERAAINFPIQSLQADIIKIAMIDIWSRIKDKGLEVRLLLQVHDELVFEIQEDKVEYYINLIRPLMENALKLNVPVVVDAKVGDNWGEMENFS
jgi:DNA polymerase-1